MEKVIVGGAGQVGERRGSASDIAVFKKRYARDRADTADESVRRSQIMEATLEIAAAEGVLGASLRKIAAKTGIRTASLYSFFPGGKDELVSTALASQLAAFYTHVAEDLRPDDDPAENLRRLVFAHVRWTLTNPRVAPAITVIERAHAIAPLMSAEFEHQIMELHAQYRQMMIRLLLELRVPADDAARLAELIIVVGDSVDIWAVNGPEYTTSDKPEEFAWMTVRRMIDLSQSSPRTSSTGREDRPSPAGDQDLFARGAAFADGEIVPIDQAKISIKDTGFTRSDVTYDVVAVCDGSFFRLDDHVDRFQRSCDQLRLTLPFSREELIDILMAVVRASGLRESYVEMICTRGVPPDGSRDPRTFENRFYAFAIPYMWILRPDEADTGMDAIVAQTTRRIPTDSVDPTVKNFHWGDLTRGQFEAYDRGGRYPILLDNGGFVTEGPGYNVFAFIGGELLTPASGVLEGITRRSVLELARAHDIPSRAAAITEAQLKEAAEVFATSTAGGVMPVTSIDGNAVGDGLVGPTTALIRDLYWKAHSDPRYATVVDYSK